MVTDLVLPPSAKPENIASNNNAPIAVRILCRRNQFLRGATWDFAGETPGAKFSVQSSPSQYLCWPSGCGYQPAGALIFPVLRRSNSPRLTATYRHIRLRIRGLPKLGWQFSDHAWPIRAIVPTSAAS